MISIIVPIYNTEKYLSECLSSIRAQTFSNYECLLIDDGSTDSSKKIAQQFIEQDSRFRLLNDKHIGYPACKNLGLDSARGEYICFVDSDDFIESRYLENLYNALISTNSDISNCGNHFVRDNKMNFSSEFLFDVEVFEGTENILHKYFTNTYPWAKLFKKDLFDKLRFQNVEALSDTLLNHKVFERAKRTSYTKYKGYHYRIHDNNITYRVRNYSPTYWPFRMNVYLEVCEYISKYPQLQNYAKQIINSELSFCYKHLDQDQYIYYTNLIKEKFK